jgi:hypothetical protein
MTLVEHFEFRVGSVRLTDDAQRLDPDLLAAIEALRDHVVILERWIHPLQQRDEDADRMRAAHWIVGLLKLFVEGKLSADELYDSRIHVMVKSPLGAVVLDTLTRREAR